MLSSIDPSYTNLLCSRYFNNMGMRWSITYRKCDLFMMLSYCKQFHPWLVSALLLFLVYVVRNALRSVHPLCTYARFVLFFCILALNSYWVIAFFSILDYGAAPIRAYCSYRIFLECWLKYDRYAVQMHLSVQCKRYCLIKKGVNKRLRIDFFPMCENLV